jgi:hypothetical protein
LSEINQIQEALTKGYAITPRSEGAPQDEQYIGTLRKLVSQAVYQIWNVERKPSDLHEIDRIVIAKIKDAMPPGINWKPEWELPSKRTTDRRVNEAADPRNYAGGITPIIALRPGVYMPNPQHFDGEAKQQLQELLNK